MSTPQYTYAGAPNEPPPVVTAPSEFQVRLTARCEEWRTKNPTRAVALRRFVAVLIGRPSRSALSEAGLAAMVAPLEEKIIATVYGWPATEAEYNQQQGER